MTTGTTFDMKPVLVSQKVLDSLKQIPTATVYNAVRYYGAPVNVCEGLTNFTPGKTRMAARAKTLRFLPTRVDIVADKPKGEASPEYIAMGRCGPGDVLVADIMGSVRDVVAGDVKLLQLAMNRADGVVIDGAIRDLDVILDEDYGLKVYAKARSFHGNPVTVPAEENVQIQCGGALVRPGDVLVGDNDGVLVVPSWMAEAVLQWADEHEGTENYVKEKVRAEKVAPGKYYPPTEAMKDEWLRVKKQRGL
jgi:regulator of RNase E activity RraA